MRKEKAVENTTDRPHVLVAAKKRIWSTSVWLSPVERHQLESVVGRGHLQSIGLYEENGAEWLRAAS